MSYTLERKHLNATVMKGRKKFKTTTINKHNNKKREKPHHKQNKITTTNMQPLFFTDFYRHIHQNYQLVSSVVALLHL